MSVYLLLRRGIMVAFSRIARACGVVLAIAGGAAFSPGRAAAECGDYVHIVNGTHSPTSAPGLPATLPPDAGGQPESPRKPCDGTNCSGKPSPPAIPPGVPSAGPSDYKSCAVGTATSPAQMIGTGWGIPVETNEPPIHRGNPIFHPPRA